MHNETLAPQTAKVFSTLTGADMVSEASGFYLAGGTALALQLGHRQSEDLDFFTKEETLPADLSGSLQALGKVSVTRAEARTLELLFDNVRVSFISYAYPLIRPLLSFESLVLADAPDIAAMKISAIANRGAKKDFFDLYFLLQTYSLEEMIGFFETKFKGMGYNTLHLLKSIAFFDDAEADPNPIMLVPISWEEVKKTLSREAHQLASKYA